MDKIEEIKELLKDNHFVVSFAKNMNEGSICKLLLQIVEVIEDDSGQN